MEVLLRWHGGDGGANGVAVRCHGGHRGAAATPVRIGPTRGGTADILIMFKVSTVSQRRSPFFFYSFRRCYGDQWKNHCRTTVIMAVPLRYMSYKHRSGTAPSVWRGYYCGGTAEHVNMHNLGICSNTYRACNHYISMYSLAQANRIRNNFLTQIDFAHKSMIVV